MEINYYKLQWIFHRTFFFYFANSYRDSWMKQKKERFQSRNIYQSLWAYGWHVSGSKMCLCTYKKKNVRMWAKRMNKTSKKKMVLSISVSLINAYELNHHGCTHWRNSHAYKHYVSFVLLLLLVFLSLFCTWIAQKL